MNSMRLINIKRDMQTLIRNMANTYLYIHDSESGQELLVAKAWSDGWVWHKTPDEITEWLKHRDIPSGYAGASEGTELKLIVKK